MPGPVPGARGYSETQNGPSLTEFSVDGKTDIKQTIIMENDNINKIDWLL